MRNLLLVFPTPALMALIVGGSALLTAAATYWVRRRYDERTHRANNEFAGFVFAAVGVIYGVMLAFVVLVVWQAFQATQVTIENEANTLVDVYRLARILPPPYRATLQADVLEYTGDVITDEWNTMVLGLPSAKVGADLERLWDVHRQMDADKVSPGNHDNALFDALASVGNRRRIRLLASREELPALMWGLLIGGGLITIGFTLFLRTPNQRAHLVMAGLFAGMVGFILFLTLELDNPFTGGISLQPVAFEQALQVMQSLGQ